MKTKILSSLRGALATKQSSFIKTIWIASLALAMTSCADYRAPGSSDPAKMSGDTLCYRAAYAKSSRALKEEVKKRNLDCRAVLDEQPPIGFEERY